MKKLKFTKGLAIIVLEENEVSSEYDTDTFLTAKFQFSTAAAIKRLVEELGTHAISKTQKKELLEKKQIRAVVDITLKISLQDIPIGQPIWHTKNGYLLNYENHYSGEHYSIRVPVTKEALANQLKDNSFRNLYQNSRYGSCADGGSLKKYIDGMAKWKNVIK